MSLTARRKRGLMWVVVAIFIIAILSGALIYLPQLTQRAAFLGTGQVLAPGQATCPGQPGTYAATSPPTGCLNIGQFLQITFVDAGNTATKLSGWSASLISNGGPGNSAPAGQIIDSCLNTGTNGQCTFSSTAYYPGTSLTVWICHQTTACASTSFAAQKTNVYLALPGLPGLPGGTVPFWPGTQSPTSTPTAAFFQTVLVISGDAAASNTPYKFTFQLANGTTIATASTCFLNQGSGTNPCFLGAGVTKPNFQFYITNTFTGTNPYAAGYTPFNEINIPGRGLLTQAITLEMKQTAGSDPVPVMLSGGPFPSSPTAIKQAAVPDVFYVSGDQSGTLSKQTAQDGSILKTGAGVYTFSVDASGMATSGDKTLLTFNLQIYFSITFFVANTGTLNSETVTQQTAFTLTLQTP